MQIRTVTSLLHVLAWQWIFFLWLFIPCTILKFSVSFPLVSCLIFSPFLIHLFILLKLPPPPPPTSILSKCLGFVTFTYFVVWNYFLSSLFLSAVAFLILAPYFKVFIYEIIVRDDDKNPIPLCLRPPRKRKKKRKKKPTQKNPDTFEHMEGLITG